MRQLKIQTSITNRDSQAVEKYLQEISKIQMINPEEEISLAIRIKQGDQVALEKLTKANLRFVVSVAKQYQHQGLSLADLINEGNFGLIKAAQRFDETKGFKFISYAVWWIRQSILQALAEQGRPVRIPQNKIGGLNKANKAIDAFEQEHGRQPRIDELADVLDVSTQEAESILLLAKKTTSLDDSYGDNEGELTLGDMLTDETMDADVNQEDEELIQVVQMLLKGLDQREADILRAYFGLGDDSFTIDSVGQKYSLTKERMRQIKDKTIKRIQRRTSTTSKLKQYLG